MCSKGWRKGRRGSHAALQNSPAPNKCKQNCILPHIPQMGFRAPRPRWEHRGRDKIMGMAASGGSWGSPAQGSLPQEGLAPKCTCPRPAAPPEPPRKVLPPSPGVPVLSNPFPPQKSIRSSRRWRQRRNGGQGRAAEQQAGMLPAHRSRVGP